MLLYGKQLAQQKKEELKEICGSLFQGQTPFLAILFFGENTSSKVYVQQKRNYGNEIGIPTIIFGQGKNENEIFPAEELGKELQPRTEKHYETTDDILNLIGFLNSYPKCVGILCQLPFPQHLAQNKQEILNAVSAEKDVDGLSEKVQSDIENGKSDFIPATPRAVLSLLDFYHLGEMKNKNIAIIGESTVVGKPLSSICKKRGANVQTFNINHSPQEIKEYTKKSDYIISCTGQIHLIDETFLRHDQSQIIVDVGYGHLNGKAVGDVDFEKVAPFAKDITPVPGSIGPLTVASLFENIIFLQQKTLSSQKTP